MVTELEPQINRNCVTGSYAGDAQEMGAVKLQNSHWKSALRDSDLLMMTRNCSWVRAYFQNNLYTTKLERIFPIAFVLVVYNSPLQVLRLLRVLYRWHNTYCIHPDLKSSETFDKHSCMPKYCYNCLEEGGCILG